MIKRIRGFLLGWAAIIICLPLIAPQLSAQESVFNTKNATGFNTHFDQMNNGLEFFSDKSVTQKTWHEANRERRKERVSERLGHRRDHIQARGNKGQASDLRVQSFDLDASDLYDTAISEMAEIDPDARLLEIWGFDSGFEDYFMDITDEIVPTGRSYEWEFVFLNDDDEMVYFLWFYGDELDGYDYEYIPDLPPGEVPHIDLATIGTLPANFASSQQALDVALNNGLEEVLNNLNLDHWFDFEYILSSYYFIYEDLFDQNSPPFWEVILYEDFYDNDHFVEQTTVFLVNALNGNFIDVLVREYEGSTGEVTALYDVFSQVAPMMPEIDEHAIFVQAFGSEDFSLPDLPEGKSNEWMMVWINLDTEEVNLFFSEGGVVYDHEMANFSDFPEDERPDLSFVIPVQDEFVNSDEAVQVAMINGMMEFLQNLPYSNMHTWIRYNLLGIIGDDERDRLGVEQINNPLWFIHTTAQFFDEVSYQPIFQEHNFHYIDAYTGQHLATQTATSSETFSNQQPTGITLHQNYPNPFNPVTIISWEMDTASYVTLRVFDALGREVAVLANEFKNAGTHSTLFDSTGLSSGVYIYILESEGTQLRKKMTLIK
ncbi:T9SS type A sorting domain-containing protein [Balneolaceae bacterium ANBcel3]|nr:T9SS type A sorting domain-containing protein [Balneolaceae bacterium ANBcel3]